MRFFAILLLLTASAFAQRSQTISADCLKLGASGECITQAEFNTLHGATGNVQDQLDDKVGITGNESIAGEKTFTGKITASSTSNGFKPCPDMTTTQRDAIASPAVGDCVYNTTIGTLNVFNGTVWKSAGGGVNQWITATPYLANDVVIESNKLYIALTDHTSGTFATDLANGEWQVLGGSTDLSSDVSGILPMANGGTDKALTPVLGGVVYTDAGSMEILAPGTSGQVLQSNGAAAPSFVNKSISGKAGSNSSVTLEEIQVPHNQLTETDTNKHNLETGNPNKLINPGFEHSTASTGWLTSVTGTAMATITTESPSVFKEGNKSGIFTCNGGASGGTCLFYQDVPSIEIQGLVKAILQSSSSTGVKLYTRVNGTSNLSKDVSTIADTYKIPQVMGATSTGIGIHVTAAASQTITVKADEAFTGPQSLLTEVPTCNGSVECETVFSAKVSATGVITDTSIPGWLTSCSLAGTATTCLIDTGKMQLTSPMNCGNAITTSAYDGTANGFTTTTSSISWQGANSASGSLAKALQIVCHKTGADYVKAKATSPGFSTTNADTDWQSCGHTASDFTGFGTVTNIETQCKRQGSDLLMRGSFTPGVGTAVEARLNLKLNGVALTSATTSKIPSIQLAGDLVRASFSTTYFRNSVLIEPSVGYITFGTQSSTTEAASIKATGTQFASVKTSINARIPINGWENSNVIIGSFKDAVYSQGSGQGVDIQSVYFAQGAACVTGTCAINFQVGSKITSVTWVSAGRYRLNGLDGTKYVCHGSGGGVNYKPILHLRGSSTSTYAEIAAGSGASAENLQDASVTCIGKP